eukprot:PhM_4_TR11242/c0_g1_i1/m.15035
MATKKHEPQRENNNNISDSDDNSKRSSLLGSHVDSTDDANNIKSPIIQFNKSGGGGGHTLSGSVSPTSPLQKTYSSVTVLDEATTAAVSRLRDAVGTVCPDTSSASLLHGAINDLLAAVEDHIVSFYGHMRRQQQELDAAARADEANAVRTTMSYSVLGLPDPSETLRAMSATTNTNNNPGLYSSTSVLNIPTFIPQQHARMAATTTTHGSLNPLMMSSPRTRHLTMRRAMPGGPDVNVQMQVASHLYLTLESLMVATKSLKGAIYLPVENTNDMLRAAMSIGDGLPADVSLVTGTSIGTVYTTGVAYNLADAGPSHIRNSNVSLNVKSVVCFPILMPRTKDEAQQHHAPSAAGCVVVADTALKGGYTRSEELRVWGMCQLLTHALQRYPLAVFQAARVFDTSLLRATSVLPAIIEAQQPSDETHRDDGDDGDEELRRDQCGCGSRTSGFLPPQVVYRTTGRDTYTQKDLAESTTLSTTIMREVDEAKLSDEVLLECATYVASLERLWRDSLDSNSSLQREIERWQTRVENREAEIVAKEMSMKTMVKQFRVMKTDVTRIKTKMREDIVANINNNTNNNTNNMNTHPPAPPGGGGGGGKTSRRGSLYAGHVGNSAGRTGGRGVLPPHPPQQQQVGASGQSSLPQIQSMYRKGK